MTLLKPFDNSKKKKWIFGIQRRLDGQSERSHSLWAYKDAAEVESINKRNAGHTVIEPYVHGVYRTKFQIVKLTGMASRYVARLECRDIEADVPVFFDMEAYSVSGLFMRINESAAWAAEINVAPGVFEAHIVFEKVGDSLQARLFDHDDPKANPDHTG